MTRVWHVTPLPGDRPEDHCAERERTVHAGCVTRVALAIFRYLSHACAPQVLIDEKRKLQQEKREKGQTMKAEGDKFYEAMRTWRRFVAALLACEPVLCVQ